MEDRYKKQMNWDPTYILHFKELGASVNVGVLMSHAE